MTEIEQKAWDKGYDEGCRDTRRKNFIFPMLRYILTGLSMALGIIFAILTIGCLIACFIDTILGIIGLIVCGALSGTAFSLFAFFYR